MKMSNKCPLCGAEVPPGGQCRDRFDLCLAMEFDNPVTFGAVHHLTVACYMLQHNEYSRIAWLEARIMVARFIREDITPAAMRTENRSKMDGRHRTWNMTKGARLSEFDVIVWSRTLADVCLDNPEVYCADVRLWAESILKDNESIMLKQNFR
jgi:hypothetical protein